MKKRIKYSWLFAFELAFVAMLMVMQCGGEKTPTPVVTTNPIDTTLQLNLGTEVTGTWDTANSVLSMVISDSVGACDSSYQYSVTVSSETTLVPFQLNGNTLTMTSAADTITDSCVQVTTQTYNRLGAGSGLAGTWVNSGMPQVASIPAGCATTTPLTTGFTYQDTLIISAGGSFQQMTAIQGGDVCLSDLMADSGGIPGLGTLPLTDSGLADTTMSSLFDSMGISAIGCNALGVVCGEDTLQVNFSDLTSLDNYVVGFAYKGNQCSMNIGSLMADTTCDTTGAVFTNAIMGCDAILLWSVKCGAAGAFGKKSAVFTAAQLPILLARRFATLHPH